MCLNWVVIKGLDIITNKVYKKCVLLILNSNVKANKALSQFSSFTQS